MVGRTAAIDVNDVDVLEQAIEDGAGRGDIFDRLVLKPVIYPHEVAIDMVEEIFAAPGAGKD
ncbi:hypothetical protein BH23ACT4_BH23ACT4_08410 [soil metagenome]